MQTVAGNSNTAIQCSTEQKSFLVVGMLVTVQHLCQGPLASITPAASKLWSKHAMLGPGAPRQKYCS